MARWKLTEPHYLTVPGTKWEYQEIDRITGRPKRTQFDVPLYLDPKSPDDLKIHGQIPPGGSAFDDPIMVVWDGNGEHNPKDIEFRGGVTTGMFPLDDTAKEITAAAEKRWGTHATGGIDDESQAESFTNKLLSGLIDQMTEIKSAAPPMAPGMEEFMTTMAAMMKQQTEILSRLAQDNRRKL